MRAALLLVACCATALAWASAAAHASFTSSAIAAPAVATLTVGQPGSFAATTLLGCTSISLSWTRAANADTYAVERQVGSGTWQWLVTDTGDVTTWSDSAEAGTTVRYRITARHGTSSWTGASVTSNVVSC